MAIWKSDRKIREEELRGDQALSYGKKLNVWDEASNEMVYVVINMGSDRHELNLYGLAETEYFVDEEIDVSTLEAERNQVKTGALLSA